QIRFVRAAWKEQVNRFQMRAGHGENVRGPLHQSGRKGLAAEMTDVHPLVFANLNGVETWRLPSHRVNPGRCHFDVLSVPDEPIKQALRDRATANISRTNK